jgi:dimethylhistidine N-methyltransferase
MIAHNMHELQEGQRRQLQLADFAPELGSFRDEVLCGLGKPQKELPSKFLYDERGSQLFQQISALDEYYLTRTELGIMRDHAGAMAEALGPRCLLIEYGSGTSTKTRLLLNHLQAPAAYVPIDISKEHLMQAACALAEAYPDLEVLPVCADYTTDFALPTPGAPVARRVVYYPGSTIGNFDREPALRFLQHIARVCGPGGGLLIGVDLSKDPVKLHHAYNDWEGVTAAFNLNLLARINRELGADFPLDRFRHYAFYNPREGRVEMHLVSLASQTVHVGETAFSFEVGESIWTESSYKYRLVDFADMAGAAGFAVGHVWTDPQGLFSVHYLTVAQGRSAKR